MEHLLQRDYWHAMAESIWIWLEREVFVGHTLINLVAAVQNTDRVLDDPQPVCQLKDFGDNAIELELRFWIHNPENGIGNVSSAVRMKIWDAFKANGIRIPFPQRVVHMAVQQAD